MQINMLTNLTVKPAVPRHFFYLGCLAWNKKQLSFQKNYLKKMLLLLNHLNLLNKKWNSVNSKLICLLVDVMSLKLVLKILSIMLDHAFPFLFPRLTLQLIWEIIFRKFFLRFFPFKGIYYKKLPSYT